MIRVLKLTQCKKTKVQTPIDFINAKLIVLLFIHVNYELKKLFIFSWSNPAGVSNLGRVIMIISKLRYLTLNSH